MVSSGSPAQRLALEELDATIRDLHRRKWGREERRGKEGDEEPKPRQARFIYPTERRLTETVCVEADNWTSFRAPTDRHPPVMADSLGVICGECGRCSGQLDIQDNWPEFLWTSLEDVKNGVRSTLDRLEVQSSQGVAYGRCLTVSVAGHE